MRFLQTLLFIGVVSCFAADKLPMPSGKAELVLTDVKKTQEVKTFQPRIENNSIISGNKLLEMNPNGQMLLNCDGDTLARFHYYFTGKNAAGNSLWITAGDRGYSNEKSTLKKDGNKFIYDGFLTLDGIRWKQYHQEVELQADGLIRVDCEWFPCPDSKIDLKGHSFWIVVPRGIAAKQKFVLDGKSETIMSGEEPRNGILSTGRTIDTKLTLFAEDGAKSFAVFGTRTKDLSSFSVFDFKDVVRTSISEIKETRKLRFYIDIRQGTEKAETSGQLAGIDFKKIENLDMPDRSSKNLFRNPSFEQGFHEYFLFHPGYDYSPEKWKTEPFVIDEKEHLFGRKSLRIQIFNDKDTDFRSLNKSANLSGSPVVVEPGTYTCSFYAKGDADGQILNVWFNRFRSGSYYGNLKDAVKSVKLTKEWKRYSFTFDVSLSKPIGIHMNATSPAKKGFVWIDGLLLELGKSATAFETKAVEGELVTSAKDNFVSAKDKINAKMKLNAAAGTKGTATVTVKNFYNEQLFKQSFSFQTDKNGIAEIKLPFDGKLGKGLFMIRTDYKTADGKTCFDQYRLTVADFLENKHRLKRIYAKQYAGEANRPDLPRLLDRYRKVGFGTETHIEWLDKPIWDLYRSYGIEPLEGRVWTTLYRNGREKVGFGILKPGVSRRYAKADDKENIFIRDFYLDSDGKITPEYLEKVKEAVKVYVSNFPWIKYWIPRHEFFASFPVDWWSKTNNPDEAAEKYALYLKAFADGVKEVYPDAKIIQDEPSSMNPAVSIPETDRLLAACNKLGVKFDIIGFHPYRYSPENPDLDADTQTVFKMLEKNGYSDKTPLHWGEMMHWGPYNIPQWGTKSSSWTGTPTTWSGHSTLSYDMGWTEKLSAAWRARAWLVALKYSDRVMTAQSGNTNNFALDYNLTPRASQMVSNTLGNLLGDCKFKRDIRFAPYTRAYVFEDAQKRPVAAVWCHKEDVDSGYADAPIAEADFQDSLESVIDLMNQERAFVSGKMRFPLMSAPLFFRGKPGTLDRMISALEKAVVVSGDGISPVMVSVNPVSPEKMSVTMKNFLSAPFSGTFDGTAFSVPGNGTSSFEVPLPRKLSSRKIAEEPLNSVVSSSNGAKYNFALTFRAHIAKKVADNVTLASLNWKELPSIPMTNYYRNKKDPSFRASYRMAWNAQGFFIEAEVKDAHFSHYEFPQTDRRWDNDCLQIYFDTLCDARSRVEKGYDENDYDYAVYPNKSGTRSIVWRARSADQQLGLGIHAPKDNSIANDIPSEFIRTQDGYIYRIFFPAKYLLPASMKKGHVMGVGVFAANANDDSVTQYTKRRVSGLSNTIDGKDCNIKPHQWPAVLLWD